MTEQITRIEASTRGSGLIVTLESGDNGNHLCLAELARLTAIFDDAESTHKNWLLIRHSGRDFCLGRGQDPGGDETRDAVIRFVQRLQSLDLLTLAVADGGVSGFGVGLFALADISVASNRSWFQFPEILGGRFPAIVATWLFDRVPLKQALYWTIAGVKFEAYEAVQFGLASAVTPSAELVSTTDDMIRVIDQIPGAILRNAKSAADVMRASPPDLAIRRHLATKWLS